MCDAAHHEGLKYAPPFSPLSKRITRHFLLPNFHPRTACQAATSLTLVSAHENLSISRQLIVLVVALMAAFTVATYYQLKSATDAIYNERYGMLRTQVQSAISVLQSFQDKEKPVR